MSHRKLMEEYYCDINNLTDLLSKLANNYRLLIGGAGEMNSMAVSHKKDVKDALHKSGICFFSVSNAKEIASMLGGLK